MNFLLSCTAFICILHLVSSDSSNMIGFVVNGAKAKIQSFPHSAFMGLTCEKNFLISKWRCGASILNQKIFLTAAHCFDACQYKSEIIISVGHVHRHKGKTVKIEDFKIHPNYRQGILNYDIALARGREPITFSRRVKRVAIMGKPPYFEKAAVAGWGYVNEIKQTTTDLLHYTQQKVQSRNYCRNTIKAMLPGTFCAKGTGYASLGDSGSALVVRKYIQIGLVSYKNPYKSRKIIVYTDVGYYYNWITRNTKKLLCK